MTYVDRGEKPSTLTEVEMEFDCGPTEVRSVHPYGFRSGEWGRILTIGPSLDGARDCYLVAWPDGVTDWWVVDDPGDVREFR